MMDPRTEQDTADGGSSDTGDVLFEQRLPLVALAGNPNTGKTSLFNRLTGSQARVGNYPGVTVERLTSQLFLPGPGWVELMDLPGSYSLVARSREEQVAIDALMGLTGGRSPDLVVVCVDATNLLRNLYLVLQLLELELPVLVALTMMDEAKNLGIDVEQLSRQLGCPVVPVVPRTGEGLDQLKARLIPSLLAPHSTPTWKWKPSPTLQQAIDRTLAVFPPSWPRRRALALWALMSIDRDDELDHVPEAVRRVVLEEAPRAQAIDDEVILARYAWLDSNPGRLLKGSPDRRRTERADAILLHPVWGFAVFLGIMFVVFQSLFAGADPAITLIENLFSAIGDGLRSLLPQGILLDLLVDGIIGGVGSVVVFLPQLLLLFFFIGMMEDSGYMARVAYLMDRIMRSMGLHGRAFVPMLSGFACAIPAVMATRTMERQRDRLLTMMVVPLMTCSARLPVYTLIIGALFPASQVLGIFPVQGLLMIGMYLFSVTCALATAFVLSKTILRAPPVPLVMELPPYRLPRLADVGRMIWRRTRSFLTEAGTVILVCTVVLWGLLTFPRAPEAIPASAAQTSQATTLESSAPASAELEKGEALRHSYAGQLGQLIEPVLAPLGFDWKIGVGLIGAFAAREVFVATLGVVYNVGDEVDEESSTLRERMRAELHADGRPVYTPLMGASLLVFFALACQCMSTLAVVKRETGGWKWPAFLFAYMTTLAWISSFIVYQGGRLLGLG